VGLGGATAHPAWVLLLFDVSMHAESSSSKSKLHNERIDVESVKRKSKIEKRHTYEAFQFQGNYEIHSCDLSRQGDDSV
jgi:hypothetical protein